MVNCSASPTSIVLLATIVLAQCIWQVHSRATKRDDEKSRDVLDGAKCTSKVISKCCGAGMEVILNEDKYREYVELDCSYLSVLCCHIPIHEPLSKNKVSRPISYRFPMRRANRCLIALLLHHVNLEPNIPKHCCKYPLIRQIGVCHKPRPPPPSDLGPDSPTMDSGDNSDVLSTSRTTTTTSRPSSSSSTTAPPEQSVSKAPANSTSTTAPPPSPSVKGKTRSDADFDDE